VVFRHRRAGFLKTLKLEGFVLHAEMAAALGDALANAKTVQLETLQVCFDPQRKGNICSRFRAVVPSQGKANTLIPRHYSSIRSLNNRSICVTAAAGDGAVARQRPSAAPGGGGDRY
jgi:hypothetical protein